VPTGAIVNGHLRFLFPDTPVTELKHAAVKFTFSFEDAFGKRYETTFPAVGKGGVSGPKRRLYLPGTRVILDKPKTP